MNKPIHQYFINLAGSFICLYLAFSPAVNITYATHDSVRYFHKFYNYEADAPTNPFYFYLKSDGRFVAAEFEEFIYKKVHHLSDMSRLRIATIIVVALSASLLIMFAGSAGMGAVPAFCLGTAVFTLPGFEYIIFAPYPFVALAMLLPLLAYLVLRKKLLLGLNFIFTFIILESTFFMYPPATFFFLVPTTFLAIFGENWQVIKKTFVRDLLLWGLAAAVYYFITRVFLYAQIKSTGHEIAFTVKQVLPNVMLFLPLGLPQIFNLWNVYYSFALGICMIIFVGASLGIDCFVTKKIGPGKLGVLAVLFFVFNLVWFLFGGYLPRQFIAAQALALALVYWCFDWLCCIGQWKEGKLVKLWPVLFLTIGLINANQMTTSNALNNYSELMFVRSRLAQFVNSSTNEIHFIRLKDVTKGYNGLPNVYDNINSATPDYEFPDLVRLALKDLPDTFELHCMITTSEYGQPFKLLSRPVVVDMNDLVYILSSK